MSCGACLGCGGVRRLWGVRGVGGSFGVRGVCVGCKERVVSLAPLYNPDTLVNLDTCLGKRFILEVSKNAMKLILLYGGRAWNDQNMRSGLFRSCVPTCAPGRKIQTK